MALSFEHVKHVVENVPLRDGFAYIRQRFSNVNEAAVPHLLLQFVSDFAHGFPYEFESSLNVVREYKQRYNAGENVPEHLVIASRAIANAVNDKVKELNMHIGWSTIEMSIMLLTLSQRNRETDNLYSVQKMLYENKNQFTSLNKARTRGVF